MIELSPELQQAIDAAENGLIVFDPRTNQAYRLIREEVYQRVQGLLYDDSPWTPDEMNAMAGAAFANLDDTDWSEAA